MKPTIAVFIALAATPAVAVDCLDPGRHLTMNGTIVQSAFTVHPNTADYRVIVQRPFMAIALDFPLCADGGRINGLIVVQVEHVAPRWLGHHVVIHASVFRDTGTVTPVEFLVTEIRETPTPYDHPDPLVE
ncbi:MAG: hypothetical protein WCC90_19650 [Methylocella sp.]